MPIYEFFCQDCNTIFSFFSRRISPDKKPDCPRCGRKEMPKMMSTFATIGKAREDDADDALSGMDEAAMERAFAGLMQEAGNINEDDPRQMAGLMRKFSSRTGINFGDKMEEALARMEAGEDPELIEQEMGDVFDPDEDLSLETMKKKAAGRKASPRRDEKLYEL